MVARGTSLPGHELEYDLWFNVNDVVMYFTLLAGVLPFWAMRFVAREKEGAVKTGVVANLIISIIATLIYIPLVPVIISALGISEKYILMYFLIAVQIVELYSLSIFEACLQAKIPQTIGYGLLVQQFGKVILGYVFIIQLQQPLLGAVLATIAAFLIQIGYYFKLLANELKQKIRWEYMKEWLKGSMANIYNVVGNQIAMYIFIMLFAYGGDGARGRYGAAVQIANVITYSAFLAFALYPKLLIQRRSEDITLSLKMVLMFAIPMTAGAIALSNSYIIILKEEYRDAGPVLIILAIDAFVATVSGLFNSVLFGVERFDEKAKISFNELAKSRLFVTFSLPYVHSAITLPTAFYVLTTYASNQPFRAALYVSIINFSARLAMFLVLYAIVRKMIKIGTPWRSIVKYVFASAAMVAFLVTIPPSTKLSSTLGATAVGGIIYSALLMLIDKEVRMLTITAWREIKIRIKRVI